MVVKAANRGRGLADYTSNEVCLLTSDFLGSLETWDSHFFVSFSNKDGSEIMFWEDKWLGNATLQE
jgi:hypothetical protein